METNPTIEERQEKDKQALIEALKEMPIIQLACRKAGISRATYYRWCEGDKEFRRQSDDALSQGVEFINDMSESQLITLIKEKKMPAIAMWLKHNHKRYGAKMQNFLPVADAEDLTLEEQVIMREALALASGGVLKNKYG